MLWRFIMIHPKALPVTRYSSFQSVLLYLDLLNMNPDREEPKESGAGRGLGAVEIGVFSGF